MGDEEAFLRAIAQAPDDDAPRLVYADWLDERGDPRADYVRVVTRAAGLASRGLPWDDLTSALGAASGAAPAAWRDRVGPWFDVLLDAVVPDGAILAIKAIRERTGKGLAEAKAVVDALAGGGPAVVATRLPLDRAEDLRAGLEGEPWPRHWRRAPAAPPCRTSLRPSAKAAEPQSAPDTSRDRR
jgi:uncharacterized protein (TIGR02996 family)